MMRYDVRYIRKHPQDEGHFIEQILAKFDSVGEAAAFCAQIPHINTFVVDHEAPIGMPQHLTPHPFTC
jgi:hypothetical protein